jgi:uncharacterized protein YeaO (DUF488 family)
VTRIALKRVYDPPAAADGTRVLVDRLWPRGIAKAKARIDLWLRDVAPSDALRRRFHAKPEDWDAFCTAYFDELEQPVAQAAARELRSLLRKGPVTLLYASRDQARNNAAALRRWLARRTKK